jgi:DDE superfamily endonuclease
MRLKKWRQRLKRLAAAHHDWVLGYQDEVWFSRLAQPRLHAWTTDKPLPLELKSAPHNDPDPQALACYGLLRADSAEMMLRFVQGRPVSGATTQFLHWLLCTLAGQGTKVLLLLWDNASWHLSQQVQQWIKAHNRKVKAQGGCRLLACRLPVKSPWLNNIAPKWVHGKRNTLEPQRILSAQELKTRLCHYYGCEALESLEQ